MKDSFESLSKREMEKIRHELSNGISMVRTMFMRRAMFDADTATKVFEAGIAQLTRALAEIDSKLSAARRGQRGPTSGDEGAQNHLLPNRVR